MVRPERLELPAYWFEASRSIQLSYGRTLNNLTPTQCRIEAGNGLTPSRFYQRTDLLEEHYRGGDPKGEDLFVDGLLENCRWIN